MRVQWFKKVSSRIRKENKCNFVRRSMNANGCIHNVRGPIAIQSLQQRDTTIFQQDNTRFLTCLYQAHTWLLSYHFSFVNLVFWPTEHVYKIEPASWVNNGFAALKGSSLSLFEPICSKRHWAHYSIDARSLNLLFPKKIVSKLWSFNILYVPFY